MHNFLSNQVRSHQSSKAMFTLSDCKIWNHFKPIINHFKFTVFNYAIDKENRAAARQFGVGQKNVLKVAITTRNIERSLSWSESSTLMPSKIFWIFWRKNWRNWLTRRGRPDGKSKKHCLEWVLSFGTSVSSFHGLTWLVDSPEESNFTKTRQLWGETSEISSLCYCWTDLTYFWNACKFYGGLKQEIISVNHDNGEAWWPQG